MHRLYIVQYKIRQDLEILKMAEIKPLQYITLM